MATFPGGPLASPAGLRAGPPPVRVSTCLHPAPGAGHVCGVTQPDQQQEPTASAKTGTESTETEGIFTAYSGQQHSRGTKRRYFLYPAAALVLLALGLWTVKFEQEAPPIRVDTLWGLRSVRKGMTPQQVQSVLGQPTSKDRNGNVECYQYGKPTINAPTFTLHVVCYEDGKLRDVSEKRYNSWVITPDGAMSPAPLEEQQPQPPDEPTQAPRGPRAPGIANQTSP